MSTADKTLAWLAWLAWRVKTPPFSPEARLEAGLLLRRLQQGEKLSLPHSRPMPSIGTRCHELRVNDDQKTWRLIYRIDTDAVVLAEVFQKTTQKTPKAVIDRVQGRLKGYDDKE